MNEMEGGGGRVGGDMCRKKCMHTDAERATLDAPPGADKESCVSRPANWIR